MDVCEFIFEIFLVVIGLCVLSEILSSREQKIVIDRCGCCCKSCHCECVGKKDKTTEESN